MSGSLLVIAPHPDDEILGAGGIMAQAKARGDRVAVVVATDGARSNPDTDPTTLVRNR
ncbi:MAG: PIG-L family deacetylase, partial [Sphingomonas sp.]